LSDDPDNGRYRIVFRSTTTLCTQFGSQVEMDDGRMSQFHSIRDDLRLILAGKLRRLNEVPDHAWYAAFDNR